MSNPNDKPTTEPTEPTDRFIPPWALAARIMAEGEDPNDPSGIDWDAWKDEQKENDSDGL